MLCWLGNLFLQSNGRLSAAISSGRNHEKIGMINQPILADVPVETVLHLDFKRETAVAKAIVRTGEFTPYANVILVAGVWGLD
ncbi:MAG: hypothetical protein CL608_01950 [Anaerolineaceae bacterium]|nr:hypothetical protein [Anaerolineaceae bacterium]